LRGRKCLPRYWEPFPPKAHAVAPKFAPAFGPPAGALILADPLERLFTDQTTLAVEGGVTATAAEGVPGVVNRLLELPAAVRIAAVVPEFAIGAGIDAEH